MPAALNLDFAKARRLDPRISFSRASSATYVGKDGLIKSAQAGEARFDFDPISLACKGLLIEESRTNLLTYSEQFDNAAWPIARSTITPNQGIAPDGALTADLWLEDATAGTSYSYRASQTFTIGNTYCLSVYAKYHKDQRLVLSFPSGNGFAVAVSAAFNLQTGVVDSGVGAMISVGNGWYRCTIVGICTTTTTANWIWANLSESVQDVTSGLYIWGAQLEVGAFPTSYIPTTTAAVTRSADVASMAGANFSSWYNPSEGTFVVEADAGGSVTSDQSYLFGASDNTASNVVAVTWAGSGSGIFATVVATTSQLSGVVESNGLSPRNATRRAAMAYKVNDASLFVSGAKAGNTDTSMALPTALDRLYLGVGYNGANRWLNGHLASLAYFNTRLAEADLKTLSAPVAVGPLPSLLLNFAKSKRLDPRITFSRASVGTYVGADGLLKTAQAGDPRFDHDPITLACRGLLIEEQRTNLLTYSEQLDNAAWTKSSATVTANAIAAPDGSVTADKLVESATTATHFLSETVSVTSGSTYVFSAFFKGTERKAALRFATAYFATTPTAYFDLATGVVSSTTGTIVGSGIEAYGDGWFRCWLAATATATGASPVYPFMATTIDAYAGDGISGIHLWGIQCEAGAFPTSYITTTSAAATRSADVATMTGVNFSSWYRQNEGTFIASAQSSNTNGVAAHGVLCADNGTSAERVILQKSISNSANGTVIDDTATQFAGSIGTGGSWNNDDKVFIGIAYALNDFMAAKNGALSTGDANGTVPTPTQLQIGKHPGSVQLNGRIALIAYYPKRLTNAELQGLTL